MSDNVLGRLLAGKGVNRNGVASQGPNPFNALRDEFATPPASEMLGGLVNRHGRRLAPPAPPKLPPSLNVQRTADGRVVVNVGQGDQKFSFIMDQTNVLPVLGNIMLAAGVASISGVRMNPDGSVGMRFAWAEPDEPASPLTDEDQPTE